MDNIIELTHANFDDLLAKHELVLIDFWAEWCAPCKDFTKVIEKISPDYPEFMFGSINIEDEKELTEEFNIRSVPAVMILRDSVCVYADSGSLNPENLRELLDKTKDLDPEELAKQKGEHSESE